MKKVFFLLMSLTMSLTCMAQSDDLVGSKSTVKVKKEKKNKSGLEFAGTAQWLSLGDYKTDMGFGGSLLYKYTGAFSPRLAQPKWYYTFATGITYASNNVIFTSKQYGTRNGAYTSWETSESETATQVQVAPLQFGIKDIINSQSIHGKWYWEGDVSMCFLSVNPCITTSSTKISGSNKTVYHLSSEMGMNIRGELKIGYEFKKFGLSIGGFGQMSPVYTDEAKDHASYYGGKVDLNWYF